MLNPSKQKCYSTQNRMGNEMCCEERKKRSGKGEEWEGDNEGEEDEGS